MFDNATPKPWHFCDSESEVSPRYVLYVSSNRRDGVFGKDVGYFENAEDAALCSAAPDMLEVLREIADGRVGNPVIFADTFLRVIEARAKEQLG